jgi:hypothetical protein
MAFTKRVEFGNYTLKFGEKKVLLDFVKEIVDPSFQERRYLRTIKGKADFFFMDTKLLEFKTFDGVKSTAIVGRMVKNTKLKREQIFKNGVIVADKKELETAPTSVFVLLLENHRLIFCKEMAGAPTIQNFESTSHAFLKRRHKEYLHEVAVERGQKPTEKLTTKESLKLVEEFPTPSLRVTPLSDKLSLSDFVDRFKTIDKLTIKLLPTNNEELDNDDFWNDLEKTKEKMNSSNVVVQFNNGKDGLNAEEVKGQTKAASVMGNSAITMKGHDAQGDTLNGSNDDFSLSIELEALAENLDAAANTLFTNFQHLAKQGVIVLPVVAQEVTNKIRKFIELRGAL